MFTYLFPFGRLSNAYAEHLETGVKQRIVWCTLIQISLSGLEQQVRSLQQQLTDVTERERESRTESARLADTARGARESEERRVAEVTREAVS